MRSKGVIAGSSALSIATDQGKGTVMVYFAVLVIVLLLVNTYALAEWLLKFLPHPLGWTLPDEPTGPTGPGSIVGLDFNYAHHVMMAGTVYIVLPLFLVMVGLVAVLIARKGRADKHQEQ